RVCGSSRRCVPCHSPCAFHRRRHTARAGALEAAMTVGETCKRDVVVALKTEMVVDLARRMRTSHVGALIIVENHLGHHRPIGIVTDRDIVVSAVAGDPVHLNYLFADDMMTTDLVTAPADESLEQALQKMQRSGVRRLPVVDGEATWLAS